VSLHLRVPAVPVKTILAMDFVITALTSVKHASLHITAILARVEVI